MTWYPPLETIAVIAALSAIVVYSLGGMFLELLPRRKGHKNG